MRSKEGEPILLKLQDVTRGYKGSFKVESTSTSVTIEPTLMFYIIKKKEGLESRDEKRARKDPVGGDMS